MIVCGIHGLKRSGKDTVADMLLEYLPNTEKYALATPIKEALQYAFMQVYRCDLSFDDMDGKTSFDREAVRWDAGPILVEAIDYLHHKKKRIHSRLQMIDKITPLYSHKVLGIKTVALASFRQLMQALGTDLIVNMESKYYWTDLIPNDNFVIITDIRQQHELSILDESGAPMIIINNPRCQAKDGHITEQGFKSRSFDIVIHNTGTLDDLRDKVKVIVDSGLLHG